MYERPTIDYPTAATLWEYDGHQHTTVSARLVWFKHDPATVWLVMTDPFSGEEQPWVIGRSLFVRAMAGEQAGLHDVVVEASDDPMFGKVLLLHLDSPDGHMHVLLNRSSVLVFLAQAKFIVPQRQEAEVYAKQISMERFAA